MVRSSLAVYLFGYNLLKIRYPWVASLMSALDLADAVYFNACPSEDGFDTNIEDLFGGEIYDGRLKVFDQNWGDHHTVQAKIGNYLLDQIGHDYDFALKLDADEVLHEDSFDAFRRDLAAMKMGGWALGKPNYTHFCPDDKTTFPFIYSSKATVSRTTSNLRFETGVGGDACALGGFPEADTHLQVHHYGKMHMGRREAALYKEQSFTKLYYDMGFPDKKVDAQQDTPETFDYMKVFDVSAGKGEFQPFPGTHPKFVQRWLEHRRRDEAEWRSIFGTQHND